MGEIHHAAERAALLHAIRWDPASNRAAIERIAKHTPKQLLVAVMDAIFKIEASAASIATESGAANTHLRSALDTLIALVEPPVIDLEG